MVIASVLKLVIVATVLAQGQPVNRAGQATLDFQKRVAAYLDLRKEQLSDVPPLEKEASAQQIVAHQNKLAEAIRTARAGAQPGDLFGPVAGIVRKAVEDDWRDRSPADRKAMLAEVPRRVTTKPNAVYPATAPLATIPPSLLARLPRIPEPLEYRLVGRHLVLLDGQANLIVDVLEDVIPTAS